MPDPARALVTTPTIRPDAPAADDWAVVAVLKGGISPTPVAKNAVLVVVPAANVPTPFLAANPVRVGFSVYNQSHTDFLYLLLTTVGGPVSQTFFSVILQPNAYYEDAFGYTGPVSGIWGSVSPNAQALVTDYLP